MSVVPKLKSPNLASQSHKHTHKLLYHARIYKCTNVVHMCQCSVCVYVCPYVPFPHSLILSLSVGSPPTIIWMSLSLCPLSFHRLTAHLLPLLCFDFLFCTGQQWGKPSTKTFTPGSNCHALELYQNTFPSQREAWLNTCVFSEVF